MDTMNFEWFRDSTCYDSTVLTSLCHTLSQVVEVKR